jgi:hypothetical protein
MHSLCSKKWGGIIRPSRDDTISATPTRFRPAYRGSEKQLHSRASVAFPLTGNPAANGTVCRVGEPTRGLRQCVRVGAVAFRTGHSRDSDPGDQGVQDEDRL